MRPAFAVLLALVFAVLFVVALLVLRVVNTAGEPDTVTGILDDAEAYDFVYDRVLDAAIQDITARGIEVSAGEGEARTIAFDDPERAQAALKGFIETVLPREYVRQKVNESLNSIVPYATGRTDSFAIDLETGGRIEAIPEAVRVAAAEINLGELISDQLITPAVRDLGDSLTTEALGIGFTPDEAAETARTVLPPDWIEAQLFSVADQVAPYLSGREDNLEVRVSFRDRIPVAGQVLKEKLNDKDVLVRLVFDQIVDPIVAQVVQEITVLSFGIEITDEDVQEAVAIVAPVDWVREQGNAVIDSVVAWLMGVTDDLSLTVDLQERKAEAAAELEDLAFRKLEEQIAVTPVCATQPQAAQAASDVLRGVFPSCLPENSEQILQEMRPLISNELRDFITGSLPDTLTYSESQFRSQLPPESLETLDNLRDNVINGFVFTEQDILEMFSGNAGDGPSEGAVETIDRIRAGLRFDEADIMDRVDPDQQATFERARGWIGLGWNLRWLIFLPALLFLAGVAFIGGRGWRGRAMWAGGALTAVAVVFFIAVTVGWASTASMREFSVASGGFSAETSAEFPALTALVQSGDIENLLERAAGAWISGLAYSAAPWAVAGIVMFALAALYPKYQPVVQRSPLPFGGRRGGGDGGGGGRAAAPAPDNRVRDRQTAGATAKVSRFDELDSSPVAGAVEEAMEDDPEERSGKAA